MSWSEEEEEQDEITEMALKAQDLRRERILLQEQLKYQKERVDQEIAIARSKVAQAKEALSDLSLAELSTPRRRTIRPSKVLEVPSLEEANCQCELEAVQQRLARLKRTFERQKQDHEEEITEMLRDARHTKHKLERLIRENEEIELSNTAMLEEIKDLRRAIRDAESETSIAKTVRQAKEHKITRTALKADSVVSRVYHGKSEFC